MLSKFTLVDRTEVILNSDYVVMVTSIGGGVRVTLDLPAKDSSRDDKLTLILPLSLDQFLASFQQSRPLSQ